MAPPSKQLLTAVQKATGLDERKTKALAAQLINSVHAVASKINEPTAKAIEEAVPELAEWTQIAEEENAADTQKDEAEDKPSFVASLVAKVEKFIPGGKTITSTAQVQELLEKLGVNDNKKETAVTGVSSAFSKFLGGVMPADVYTKLEGMVPWLSDDKGTSGATGMLDNVKAKAEKGIAKAEKGIAKAGKGIDKAASKTIGAIGSLAGEAEEECKEKHKSVMQNMRDGFKNMFKKGDKGKETETATEASGTETPTGKVKETNKKEGAKDGQSLVSAGIE